MNILVLNCGSSSLKYQLINMDDESVIAKGLVERIGIEGSVLTHKPTGKDKYVVETPMKDHNIAVKLVLDALQDAEHGVIKSTDEIAAVGHRVLHAGEKRFRLENTDQVEIAAFEPLRKFSVHLLYQFIQVQVHEFQFNISGADLRCLDKVLRQLFQAL